MTQPLVTDFLAMRMPYCPLNDGLHVRTFTRLTRIHIWGEVLDEGTGLGLEAPLPARPSDMSSCALRLLFILPPGCALHGSALRS